MYTVVETGALAGNLTDVFLAYVKEQNYTVVKGSLHDDSGNKQPPTQAAITEAYEDIREWLYKKHTDAMGMKMLRGEGTKEDWVSAVAEVKTTWATPTI